MRLLQICHWVCQWKNFENRLIFWEVMSKSLVSCFFDSHCICWCCWTAVYFMQSRENHQGAQQHPGLRLQCLVTPWQQYRAYHQCQCHSRLLRLMPPGPAAAVPLLSLVPSDRAWRRHDAKNCCSSSKLWRTRLPRNAQRCTECRPNCFWLVVAVTFNAHCMLSYCQSLHHVTVKKQSYVQW